MKPLNRTCSQLVIIQHLPCSIPDKLRSGTGTLRASRPLPRLKTSDTLTNARNDLPPSRSHARNADDVTHRNDSRQANRHERRMIREIARICGSFLGVLHDCLP